MNGTSPTFRVWRIPYSNDAQPQLILVTRDAAEALEHALAARKLEAMCANDSPTYAILVSDGVAALIHPCGQVECFSPPIEVIPHSPKGLVN
jgi:hypothetical protein